MKFLPVIKNINWTREGNNFPCFLSSDAKTFLEFMNDEGFINQDDFEKIKDKTSNIIDSMNQDINIDMTELIQLSSYNGFTKDTFLNSNYIVVETDIISQPYRGYFVKESLVNGALIKYILIEDVITNLQRGMFNMDGEIVARRGFVDRLKNFNTSNVYWDFQDNSKLHNAELVASQFTTLKGRTAKPIIYEFENTASQVALDEIDASNWLIIYRPVDQANSNGEGQILRGKDNAKDVLEVPYYVSFAPTTPMKLQISGETYEWSAQTLYDEFKSNPNALTFTITDIVPFDNITGNINVFFANNRVVFNLDNVIRLIDGIDLFVFGMSNDNAYLDKTAYSAIARKSNDIILTDVLPNINDIRINEDKNIRNEPKLYTAPNAYYSLGNISQEPFILSPNFLQDKNIKLEVIESYIPEINKSNMYIKNGFYDDPFQNNVGLQLTNNYTLPQVTDAWKIYVNNHRVSQITGLATTITGAVVGTTIGAITNPISGIVSGVSGATSVINEIARRGDIKGTPDKVAVGNSVQFDFVLTGQKTVLVYNELVESELKQLSSFYHRNAYFINDFLKFDDIVTSRYHYNYCEIEEVNAITTGSISMSKQKRDYLIGKFNSGLRLWHYKGEEHQVKLGDYSKDNTEVIFNV